MAGDVGTIGIEKILVGPGGTVNKKSGKRIVVTGAGGFIGGSLVAELRVPRFGEFAGLLTSVGSTNQ